MRTDRTWFALLVAAAALLACSDYQEPPDPCAFCAPNETCISLCETPTSCFRGCVLTCEQPGPNPSCPAGHECRTVEGQLVCDPGCDDLLCEASEACGSPYGTCIPVECSARLECPLAGDLCDEFNHECVPFNGECDDVTDCPLFDGRLLAAAEIRCTSGFCSCAPLALPQIPDLPVGLREVAVVAPEPGTTLASDEDLEIAWTGPNEAAIEVVIAGLPADRADAERRAIWGHAHVRGAPQRARFSEGHGIEDGVWRTETLPLDHEETLYAFVTTLANGKPTGFSRLVPFRVENGFPALGDPCDDSEIFPGSCATPVDVHMCRSRRCRRVCLSHAECADLGLSCGAPLEGIRTCE